LAARQEVKHGRLFQDSARRWSLTAAFILGALAVFVAVIGKIGVVLDIRGWRAVVVGVIGGFFVCFAVSGFVLVTVSAPLSEPTSVVSPPVQTEVPPTPTSAPHPTEKPAPTQPTDTPMATVQPMAPTQPPTASPTAKSEGTEYVVLPRQISENLAPVPGWHLDVWSNASSVQVQGGCARLWRDLSWKDGPRDYLLICDERRNLGDSPGWNDQIKEIEVECTSENAVTVTLWESANFTGGQWQHTFYAR
jgi:hypothetical protein